MENVTNKVRRISSLEDHRALLREVFNTAKSRIVVVSPFISSKALVSDYIPSQVRSAVARGVSVQVFTDRKLNCEADGTFKQSASDGISDLTNSGAKVFIVEGIHNKTLARDNDLIAEGSFNWFSAVRVRGGENQREERSIVIVGSDVAQMISKELNDIRRLTCRITGFKPAQTKTHLPKKDYSLFYISGLALVGLATALSPSHSNAWITTWVASIIIAEVGKSLLARRSFI